MIADPYFVPLELRPASPVLRVSILDDHRLFSRTLRLALNANPSFEVVSDGPVEVTGLQAVIEAAADVVVVDIESPSGSLLLLELGVMAPHLPVLVLTSIDDIETVRSAMEGGVSGYLTMDSTLEEVADAIVAVASGQSVMSGLRLRRLVRSEPRVSDRGSERSMSDFLTVRESEVLRRLAGGESTREMSDHMSISRNTVRTHTQNVLTKLNVHTKLAAAAFAARHGLA